MSALIQQLIEAFCRLPGVGPKTAQRLAFHLLERDREGGEQIISSLQQALQRVGHCQRCRNFSEHAICELCSKAKRDDSLLCVVESPTDVLAIEQLAAFKGRYFVLMGRLSPLDGIGPEEIGAEHLIQRLDEGEISEIILATNSTVEGEATAQYIAQLAKARNIQASRLAHGIPLGGELEFVDGGTLSQALLGRVSMA